MRAYKCRKELYKAFLQASSVRYSGLALAEVSPSELSHDSVSRWLGNKDRTLTEEEVLKRLFDMTEQSIQHAKQTKRRKKTYSGKKKRHMSKVELVMAEAGKIRSLSHVHSSRKRDFSIRKEERPLPGDIEKYVDLASMVIKTDSKRDTSPST